MPTRLLRLLAANREWLREVKLQGGHPVRGQSKHSWKSYSTPERLAEGVIRVGRRLISKDSGSGAVAGSGLKTITTVRNAKTLHYH